MPHKNKPRGKRGGGPSNGGRSRWNAQNSKFGPSASSNSPFAPAVSAGAAFRGHHTLADEARNTTKRPRGMFGLDAKLRHRPVVFVSAGLMDPLKEFEVKKDSLEPRKKAQSQIERHVLPAVDTRPDLVASTEVKSQSQVHTPLEMELEPSTPPELFVLDTIGDKSLRPAKLANLPILPRQESDHDSDSSEEVILFRGRDPALRSAAESQRASPRPKETSDTIQMREMDLEIKVVEKTIDQSTTVAQPAIVTKESVAETTHQETEYSAIAGVPLPQAQAPAPAPAPAEDADSSHLDALLDGTLSDEEAALIADYMANMDDDDNDESEAHPGLGSHAFQILRDLGGTDSDAVPEPTTEDDSDEADSGEDDGAAENSELTDAQRQRIEKQDARMARLLAKQEELGFGGDNIVLYDDSDSDDQDDWQIAPKVTPRRKKKGSTKQAKIIQKKGQFPSATAMADAFDHLDLMNWHRATSNSKSRPPVHSDSELEEAMEIAFNKDRLKKAEKKRQREALRAQGLLGKNVKPDDLRVKYLVGMSKDELVFELEQFLIGEDEQITFPPLDKQARKCLHTVAGHLKIKSQSSGSGDNRHPVLFRTGRTLAYEERSFESMVNRVIRRQYFPRVDVDTEVAKAHRSGLRKDTSGSKRQDNAISYREGEIVGQHARELAAENKGRMLLEKMGWSKGMALGTLDNKGIMVPVTHVMKKSKLGLGDAGQ
ncbi:hypothetical protein BKA67DRAFT_658048 [Truncatella angustata]|uniref:Protein SQS1 n=1 Tax=Truncatella angustata TaxID=152316 RepID=A0A9P8ZX79_9PEZI|nr:uncharacterized protein BKA67DRAFT_658048 [Truncatella angustata]KAH6653704.1 hypothetical protein BKA67DRAFT_658048 [Truncatella angustata]